LVEISDFLHNNQREKQLAQLQLARGRIAQP